MIIEVAGGAGSGKTEVIKKIVDNLSFNYEIAVINIKPLNVKGEFDELGVKVIDYNTGDGCLDYNVFNFLIEKLSNYDIIFVEHTGGYICKFLSNGVKIAVLSACDGSKIIRKYPYIFQFSNIILITKIDICKEEREFIAKEIENITTSKYIFLSSNQEPMKELITWIKELL
ncbi:MAG: hypothetical protein J7K61_03460 [Thermoplasmata archaeon]|nr:hypothetical protein [Thermoplasmata archaeon]